MRNLLPVLCLKLSQVVHYLIAHGNEGIAGFKEIPGEGHIAGTFLVRNYIIGDGYHLCMPVLFSPFVIWNPKPGPSSGNQYRTTMNIGTYTPQCIAYLHPVKRLY